MKFSFFFNEIIWVIVSDFYFTSYVPTNLKFAIEKLVCLRTMDLVLRTDTRRRLLWCVLHWSKPILSEPASLRSSASTASLPLPMRNKDTVNYFIIEWELPSTQWFPRVFATVWRQNITENNESWSVAFQISTVGLYFWTGQLSDFLTNPQTYIKTQQLKNRSFFGILKIRRKIFKKQKNINYHW